jgi:hypothetical protein
MPWIRSGECCQCGECCVGDPFTGSEGPPVVETHCPLFRWLEDGRGHCTVHDLPASATINQKKYYQAACKPWPDRPEQIAAYPSCSYKFEWQD